MKRGWMLSLLVVVLGFSGVANATLTTIGTASYDGGTYSLIYEDDQGLVWLDYTHGSADWHTQRYDWAAGLNAAGVLTYNLNPGISVTWSDSDAWRLPTAEGANLSGYDIKTTEMGHLYYVSLENTTSQSALQKGPFNNLQAVSYWSDTADWDSMAYAWSFSFLLGGGVLYPMAGTYYGLAVHPGNVVSAPVPEPATMLLLASGLVGLAGLRRKFRK